MGIDDQGDDQRLSDLAIALGSSSSARLSAYVLQIEFPRYPGPIGRWSEHFGKGKSRVLSPSGQTSCAEAEIVRLLRQAGWDAGWLEDWSPTLVPADWRWALIEERELPPHVHERHARIRRRSQELTGKRGGCWDVIAWKEDVLWYIEAKGPGDGLHKNQFAWWTAAHELDLSIGLILLEWRFAVAQPVRQVNINDLGPFGG